MTVDRLLPDGRIRRTLSGAIAGLPAPVAKLEGGSGNARHHGRRNGETPWVPDDFCRFSGLRIFPDPHSPSVTPAARAVLIAKAPRTEANPTVSSSLRIAYTP